MIRIVYKDKVEFMQEVPDNAITYFRDDYFCKDFKDEETAEVFAKDVTTKSRTELSTSKTGVTYLSGQIKEPIKEVEPIKEIRK